jgi:hypothetical protein
MAVNLGYWGDGCPLYLSGVATVGMDYWSDGAPVPTLKMAANIKTINGLALASVKTVNGLAIANIKTLNGLS